MKTTKADSVLRNLATNIKYTSGGCVFSLYFLVSFPKKATMDHKSLALSHNIKSPELKKSIFCRFIATCSNGDISS